MIRIPTLYTDLSARLAVLRQDASGVEAIDTARQRGVDLPMVG